jgi:hypothetical protein
VNNGLKTRGIYEESEGWPYDGLLKILEDEEEVYK